MYIIFFCCKIGLVARSDKTVYTNVFANNPKLHTLSTGHWNFEKSLLSDMNHQILHI